MTRETAPPSWWWANRWWLVLLPVAMTVMLVGSGYRVQTFWWESGLHRETASATAGEFARVSQAFEDSLGPTRRTFQVRVTGLDEVDEITLANESKPRSVPEGVRPYQVTLAFRAAADQDLNGCRVMLLDERGRRFGGDVSGPLGQVYGCVPADTPGPHSPLLKGDRRGAVDPDAPRPEEWTTRSTVLVPEGATPSRVWITFGAPDYVSLKLSR